MTWTPDTATVEQHKVREVAMQALRGPPDPNSTSPAAWCHGAGVDPEALAGWLSEHGEVFRRWFFEELDPLSPLAKRARNVRFWAAMDRSMDVSAPNASILKLYADIMGLVGRNAIPLDDPDNEDDTEAWSLIENLPPEVLRTMADRAEERERARLGLVKAAAVEEP